MAWHGTWNGGHWDKVIPSKPVQEEVDRRSKAMKRRVQRMRERLPARPYGVLAREIEPSE